MSAHRRLLLVDFDPSNIESMTSALTAAGYKVEVARDGLAALEVFQSLSPDGVILEAFLPKKHGFEVCREIKKTPGGERVPVVIATGFYRGRKHRNQALHEYQCDAYLERPFDRKTLLETLSRVLPAGELPEEAGGGGTGVQVPDPSPAPVEAAEVQDASSAGPAQVLNENLDAILGRTPSDQEEQPSGRATTPAPQPESAPPETAPPQAHEEPPAPEPEKVTVEPPAIAEPESPAPPETTEESVEPLDLPTLEDRPVPVEVTRAPDAEPPPAGDAVAAPAAAAAGPDTTGRTTPDLSREVPGAGSELNQPAEAEETVDTSEDNGELDRAFSALTDEPAPQATPPPNRASAAGAALEDAIDERLESLFAPLSGEEAAPGPPPGAPVKVSPGDRKAPK